MDMDHGCFLWLFLVNKGDQMLQVVMIWGKLISQELPLKVEEEKLDCPREPQGKTFLVHISCETICPH